MHGELVIRGHCEPEELTEVIDGAHMRHRLLPGGELWVDVRRLFLHHGILQRGSYGMSILADGPFPEGMITIGIILQAPEALTINGMACPAPCIQLYAHGEALHYRAPPGTTWAAYSAPTSRLEELGRLLLGKPLPIPRSGCVNFRPSARDASDIAQQIDALFRLVVPSVPFEPNAGPVRHIEEQLLLAIARATDRSETRRDQSASYNAMLRNTLAARAEDYLHSHLSESFSLESIARATGISARMLEHHFRTLYGIGPMAWTRSMKLNRIHRMLRDPRNSDRSITEIASSHGFNHLGRFGQEYRKLFGETPSQTLKRA